MKKEFIFVNSEDLVNSENNFGEYQTDDWVSAGQWPLVEGVPAGTWGVHHEYKTYYKWESGSRLAHTKKEYTDFDYLLTVSMTEESAAAVIFRMKDAENGYFLRLASETDKAAFGKLVNGTETVISEIDFDIEPVTCTHVRIICKGETISVRVMCDKEASFFRNENPGTVVFEGTDATFGHGVCGIIAEGAGVQFNNSSVVDISKDIHIENDIFDVTVGAYGEIKVLKLQNEPYDTNFVTNESEHRYELGADQFFGEMKFNYSVGDGEAKAVSTGQSADSRTVLRESDSKISVSYSALSGERDLLLRESYTLEEDHLRFDIELTNVSGKDMILYDICLPISWNNHWQFEDPYERYLAATDNFISYNATYLALERAKGGSNKLVFTPDPSTDTALEYRSLKTTQMTWANPPEYYYIKSLAANTAKHSYLESSSLTLPAGETKRYSFLLHKVSEGMNDLADVLYREGMLDITVNPGLVFPTNISATLDIHTKHVIDSVTSTDKDARIEYIGTENGHHKYSLTFVKLGRIDVTVNYAGDKRGVLQFWTEEPLDAALERRTRFLIENCRITDENDPHYLSFYEWDNKRNVAKLGGNKCSNNDYEQMYDGAAFIIEKQVYFPVEEEIKMLDDYLIDLVYEKEIIHGGEYDGYLCHRCCHGRCWSDPLPTEEPYLCTRAYNYPRMYNSFLSMYKVSTRYPGFEFRFTPHDYILTAGKILRASLILQPWIGLMGEQKVEEIIDFLRREGEGALADEIHALAIQKCECMNERDYPFSSEFGTDSTGEEGAYYFSKLGGNKKAMIATIDKSVAWTGKVPVWYWQTTSNRQDIEWWIFQYTVGLHGKIFHDYYMNVDENGYKNWSFVYPFKLSPFIHINSGQPELIGKIGTNWGNYNASSVYDWDIGFPYGESAESDISLWAGLQIISADIVTRDRVFSLCGYGCNVEYSDGKYIIEPLDGVRRRVNIIDKKLSVELYTDIYTSALIGDGNDFISLSLKKVTNKAAFGTVAVTGLAAGEYALTVNGEHQSTVISDGGMTEFTYTLASSEGTLEIKKN